MVLNNHKKKWLGWGFCSIPSHYETPTGSRGGFDSLEKKAESNKDGLLYKAGTCLFPVLGKIAEYYLDVVGSEELMMNAYSATTISVPQYNKLHQQGVAIAPHVVKGENK
jgi:hypothetical protein